MSTPSTAEKIAARADIFRLLSACYYEPDKTMFAEENVFDQLHSALTQYLPEEVHQVDALSRAMQAAEQEDLLVDYARLFVGPNELLAHPYGSVYLDGPKILMGDSTMDVIARYQDADFAISADFKEMPDHIAAELEFLYLLSYNESLAEIEGRAEDSAHWCRQYKNFMADHIGRWIDPFSTNVRDHAEMDYYKILAKLTRTLILNQTTRE